MRTSTPAWASLLLLSVLLACCNAEIDKSTFADVTELSVETTFKPDECPVSSKAGDKLYVHYRGYLVDGRQFDASYDRNMPWEFVLGNLEAIDGWDMGMYDACVGEKRIIRIPPELAYAEVGAGDAIPPNATLIFETEVIKIKTKEQIEDEANPFDEYAEGEEGEEDEYEEAEEKPEAAAAAADKDEL